MQINILKSAIKLLIIAGVATLFSFISSNYTNEVIILQDDPLPFKPGGYHIAGVTDDRADKGTIAQLIHISPTGKSVINQADLQGGLSAGISRFINNNMVNNSALTPVVISIKEYKLTETLLSNNHIEGNLNVLLSFGLKKDYGTLHLVDYKSGIHYTRAGKSPAMASQQISKLLKNGLTYFNNWMNANAGTNYKLAEAVKISFIDHQEKPEGDTIYYATNRPLTWDDFQSKISSGGPFSAEVMPSIGYDVQNSIKDGTIYIAITMKTYLPKSACWANYAGRTDYALNHEQRHFDIVKIITEQYKQKVIAARLTPDNYEAFIGMQYLDSFRDMNTMQTAYDGETRHGRDHFSQSAWNEKIDKLLKGSLSGAISSLNN